ncbi:hypothetical protein GYMLUDRAFT_65453 [Collybiopsis luxurians FD-317 M1]|uniref:Unplaced genomic scaffold GYMLUscaffold_191, whole genome shotgun sequence n=1 Tax=Collybiopsis luxurians FD-317 M1 TaxID=944289 RepID=A0A0D0AIT1_9AGAR|nr:hypothetical protein GYMLUDRAFT_65453 [Collybiopsis luxurians FD-317 M1]
MKGPHDLVIQRLMEAKVVEEIPGGFQFRVRDIKTLVAYRKGTALGSMPIADLCLDKFKFPERAEDFEPGTYIDLRRAWAWTMDDDLVNPPTVPVRFSPLPNRANIRRRNDQLLQGKLSSFCPSQTNGVSWIYWFFEPPFTLKIGRTIHLSRRMMEWHRKCPNPLRIWLGAYVSLCGDSVETLCHWRMEQSTYDRPFHTCWSCGIPHREVFLTVDGLQEADRLVLSTIREIERIWLR